MTRYLKKNDTNIVTKKNYTILYYTDQDVLTLSKAHGNLCGVTAYIHQLRVDLRHTLGQEQDGILVLLPPHPKISHTRCLWTLISFGKQKNF